MQSEDEMTLLLFLLLFICPWVFGIQAVRDHSPHIARRRVLPQTFLHPKDYRKPAISLFAHATLEKNQRQTSLKSASHHRLTFFESLADSLAHCSSTQTTTRRHRSQKPRTAVQNTPSRRLQACLVCSGPAPWGIIVIVRIIENFGEDPKFWAIIWETKWSDITAM